MNFKILLLLGFLSGCVALSNAQLIRDLEFVLKSPAKIILAQLRAREEALRREQAGWKKPVQPVINAPVQPPVNRCTKPCDQIDPYVDFGLFYDCCRDYKRPPAEITCDDLDPFTGAYWDRCKDYRRPTQPRNPAEEPINVFGK